jgi:hypothetical protein
VAPLQICRTWALNCCARYAARIWFHHFGTTSPQNAAKAWNFLVGAREGLQL